MSMHFWVPHLQMSMHFWVPPKCIPMCILVHTHLRMRMHFWVPPLATTLWLTPLTTPPQHTNTGHAALLCIAVLTPCTKSAYSFACTHALLVHVCLEHSFVHDTNSFAQSTCMHAFVTLSQHKYVYCWYPCILNICLDEILTDIHTDTNPNTDTETDDRFR